MSLEMIARQVEDAVGTQSYDDTYNEVIDRMIKISCKKDAGLDTSRELAIAALLVVHLSIKEGYSFDEDVRALLFAAYSKI